jgi:hypothetical protein
MFNLLFSGSKNAWDTDQLMRMDLSRFKEFSPGAEAQQIDAKNANSLKELELVPALLLYEEGLHDAPADDVRYGKLHGIRLENRDLVFRFNEEGRFSRAVFKEFAARLGVTERLEHNRTHWAIKDASIPRDMMTHLAKTYDVAFSFAGVNRAYVEEVADVLRARGVRVFLDSMEQVALWGTHLGESLAEIYDRRARYCVMFISREYAEREWTTHERRSALDRQLRERSPYILPCRFDDTQLAGISPSIGYVSLKQIEPLGLANLILEKLGM